MTAQPLIDIEDKQQLQDYLRRMNHLSVKEELDCTNLHGGVSNRTVWVRHTDRDDWILKQALEKLRVQVDWFSAPERIHKEALGLRWLSKIMPQHVPSFVFEDMTDHILAMSAIPQPHDNWKTLLMTRVPTVNHAIQFGELLAMIHNAVADYPEIADEFADRKFFEELRLEPYYAYTASQVPAAGEFLHRLIDDTRQRNQSLVHGDYSPKNVLVYDNRLYILDYEVIHFGDPAFDVGFSMTHLLSKAHHRPQFREIFVEMASVYWETYISKTANTQSREHYAVHHTLACLLARVAGRSPLEYLTPTEQKRQKMIVLDLMTKPPETIPDLITHFVERLDTADDNN